jgi:hypothetical protein
VSLRAKFEKSTTRMIFIVGVSLKTNPIDTLVLRGHAEKYFLLTGSRAKHFRRTKHNHDVLVHPPNLPARPEPDGLEVKPPE